jgi:hypothetical protein
LVNLMYSVAYGWGLQIQILCLNLIYKSKHSVCLSLWTKIGQCLEDSSSHCPFPVELVTNRAGAGQGMAGRPGQPLWGAARGAISIKEILWENRGTCI